MDLKAKLFAALFVAVLLLSGCDMFTSRKDTTEDGKTIVTFWHAMGGVLGDVLQDLVDRYNQQQDKYYVRTEFMGRYDILEQKIIGSVMANGTPDLAQMYEGVTTLLTRDEGEESLIPLNSYIEKWGEWEDIWPVFKKNSTYEDGKIYTVPFNKSFPILFYNENIIKVLGEDHAPRTWTELASFAKRVEQGVLLHKQRKEFVNDKSLKDRFREGDSAVTDVYAPVSGYAFSIDPWHFEIMLLQEGGKMINEKRDKVFFDTEMAVDAMKFWVDAVREGWGYRTEGYNHQNDFGAQKVAFIITSVVSRGFMENKLAFPYNTAPVPSGGKNSASIMSGTNIGIFSGIGKKHTDGAWDFLRWLMSSEIAAEWAMRTYYVPVRQSALELPAMKKWIAETKGADAAIQQLPNGDMEPRSSAWYRCRIILRSGMEKIISAVEKTEDRSKDREIIKENLKEAVEKMDKELEKYQF